jgi:subfamily B ATP-binding cassette protein MsbA
MSHFRRFLNYLRPYRSLLIVAGITVVFVSALRLVIPWAGKFLADQVLGRQDLVLLNWFIVAMLGLVVIQTLVNVVQNYLLTYVGESVVADMRETLYAKIQSLDLPFFSDRSVGEITSRLTNDVMAVQQVVTVQITTVLKDLLVFVGGLSLIFYLNAQLALVMLCVIPPVVLVARIFGKRLRGLSTAVQDRLAESTSLLEETTSGVRIVKIFVREPYEQGRYRDSIRQTLLAALRRAKYRAGFVPLITLSGFVGILVVVWYGARLVIGGSMTQGDLLAFLIYTVMIAMSIGTFAAVYGQIQEALGSLRRLFELLDTPRTVIEDPAAKSLPRPAGQVIFENLTFGYDPERPVLSGIDLEVPAGEVLALVGPSGGGKSTLMNLIPRFHDPQQGRITVDGHDVRDLKLDSLREHIGIVPQETVLFSRSVRENILYGRLDASEEDIIAAAKAANCHEFITALPQGYDTLVGERGTKLSGGQRQRIAIARMLLKNPQILLLDEATSALDSESEQAVQEALGRLLQGRTTIIIAHRLSTVKIADRVAVIDAGELVELGTHDELLAKGGLYAHLYALQFRETDLTAARNEA